MTSELTRELEAAEARAWADFYQSCGEGMSSELGVRVLELRSALVTIVSSFDVLAFNRAIVTGLDAEIDAAELDAIVAAFRDAGLRRAFVQVNPDALDERTGALLASRGLGPYNRWVKLWRPVDDVPDVMADLEIVRIGPERGPEFAAVVVSSFGWPPGVEGMIADIVGRPGWRHYAAMESGRIVATAASFVHKRSAWLDFAATLPEARGKGAQSALLARRILDARDAGCARALVETSEPRPDNTAQSYRNATRMGFRVAYARQNFIWSDTGERSAVSTD